ncbi:MULTISPECIES: Lrp/AsnC family transcriptional regulator [Streptomyces]|uniref:Lrp/AsnC family transcriptional regulator n=1 Tax=Streptomyces siderophoricus TaxID=2802281 RepID=A0ABS1MK39_9ACTN|nr:Lrp/AsnC family transcriptional regulator [Streptomyces sp. 9-7]MBL1088333.1 Lrp/AsnC family transcriptional regulator [Streptomyces sp. 9-7]
MESHALDELDQRFLHILQLDARAPFARIAEQLGVSETTIARRYQRLRGLGLRISGQPVPARLGLTRWLLRLHTVPHAATTIAEALARRSDSSWVTIASGGTEICCAVTTRSRHERDVLLLEKLPRTPQVTAVSAHCLLHMFTGASSTWHATRFGSGPLSGDPDTPLPPVTLDATDHALLDQLAPDGRAPLAQLAAATGRSTSTVQRRLDRLRGTGAIGFAVDFDHELLGYRLSARLWLRVSPAHLRTVGKALATHPEIPFAAATTGPSNIVASGIFRDPHDLYRYTDQQLGPLPIDAIETAPILRDVKRLTTA